MTNVSIVLRPSRLCSATLVQEQVEGFADLLGGTDRLRSSGTMATIVQLDLPVPITQTSTGTPSEWLLLAGCGAHVWAECCCANLAACGSCSFPGLVSSTVGCLLLTVSSCLWITCTSASHCTVCHPPTCHLQSAWGRLR